ncbi:alpha/beta hydrolase [Jannaschia sp. S6380]|uniref:alpha/beta hydrolase fold domain-containing protein n=1 Tax=Jannaschia sp. S6380 TaxID=2926408 RepID=UPI001FF3D955|nr:alpha/beta hydrolase fold domain-containing protein [Jannaschia sp. S6380]MCK0166313.1 alpha/beta hydrolase [Jannaschia sp. S6380]
MTPLTWRDRVLAAATRHVLRPILALPIPWQVHRVGFSLFAPDPPSRNLLPEVAVDIAGVPGIAVAPSARGGTLLWLHGGGFVLGSPQGYRALAHGLACRTGMRVIVPAYRKAPEHPFPAGLEDALAVARALAAAGPFALGGDSAGGTLALAVCAELLSGGKCPTQMALASPAADLDPNRTLPAGVDEMLLAEPLLRRMVADYLGGADPRDPRVSPIHADFTGAPPTFLQVARAELLEWDADAIAARLRAGGAPVRVEKVAGVPHDFQLFVDRVPAATAAVDRMAAFLRGEA